MKIEHLHINGFGRLHNREIHLTQGVTVLYGRNEAGKSTTLQFIRSMLFGIPSRGNPLKGMNLCKVDCMGDPEDT